MRTLLVLTLITFSLFSKSQTWSFVYSTDSTHIYDVFAGSSGKLTYTASYRCDTCYNKTGWMVAELFQNQWQILFSGSELSTLKYGGGILFYLFNKDTIIGYGNTRFYKSINGGQTWDSILYDQKYCVPLFAKISDEKMICFADSIYIFEQNGMKIRSTFAKLKNPKLGLNRNSISITGSTIYAVVPYPIRSNTDTTTFDLLHSRDNGKTWTMTPVPIKFKPWSYSNLCISQTKENEGFISVTGTIGAPANQFDFLIRFKNDSVFYNDHIIIDTLSANKWLAITGFHFYNNCEGVITTFHDYHYKTADGGISWVKTTQAPGFQFNHAVFFDSTCVLYDGGFNGSIQKTPLIVNYTNGGPPYPTQTGCIVKAPVGIENSTHSDITVFPNPFENEIKLVLPNVNEAFEVRLYNATGQLLADYPSMRLQNTINTSQLAHGFYLLTISNSQYNYNFKLLK